MAVLLAGCAGVAPHNSLRKPVEQCTQFLKIPKIPHNTEIFKLKMLINGNTCTGISTDYQESRNVLGYYQANLIPLKNP